MKKSKKIVFFGSGPVAARSLSALANDFEVEAVMTKPATVELMSQVLPKGYSALYSVKTKSELDSLIASMGFKAPVGVVVDFGIIISRQTIDSFPLGIVNSHFSLLPEWRGADPISFAVLSGQEKTGVSLMLIDEKLDEGPLLYQEKVTIQSKVTTPNLTDQLIGLSNRLLVEKLPDYINGNLKPYSQDLSKPITYSRKLTKSDGKIDWQKSAKQIEREIRAFVEWPKSRTTLGGIEVIITKAHSVPSQPLGTQPGDIDIVPEANIIMVTTGNGSLCIDQLKPASKKEMSSQAFLAGYKNRLKL